MRNIFCLLVLFTFASFAEQKINTVKPKVYMGRQIAWTMHCNAAHWLTRTEREKEENTSEMLRELKLKPEMTIADVGCGNGYHAITMAKSVGEKGKVLCVDVQKPMLDMLQKRAKEAGVKNCVSILGEFTDPKLPKNSVDLILLVDAYHEFTEPEAMLKKMRESLKDDGVIVLVEFRKEDKSFPIKEDHKMYKEQMLKELKANGFKVARSYDKLPWQHMVFFAKSN
jgi:ubiquinone/menaquinone biosynthesis C-methylase UbiE